MAAFVWRYTTLVVVVASCLRVAGGFDGVGAAAVYTRRVGEARVHYYSLMDDTS